MKFKSNMPNSARRHLEAAELLVGTARPDVAGYLYGIAAECAIKAMMLAAGIKPLAPTERRVDPFYLHYPQLQSALRDRLQGRVSSPLTKVVNNNAFLENWTTDMRYAAGKDVKKKWVEQWRKQARDTVNSIGT